MKTTISSHSLQSKLWMALLVSVVGLSACSNEVEETPDSTMDTTEATTAEVGTDSTMGETTTDMDMADTNSPMDPAGTATTDTMMDSTTTDEMMDGSVTSDTTMVDEDNTSFNQDPVESAQ
ncbi:hypothetical protein [Psychrobacter sp. KCTC 72983]|uniref:hypothetical protein n=1 Tax=Psychrobacter sp. KCTC 72983 TaxID=2733866 RepID=UPI0016484935|nr:hypothetical protein [Psychrobacter sp. KCTC 72983]